MMKRRTAAIALIIFTTIILQACGYPGDPKATSHTAYKAQITEVQQAVDDYKKKTGVLPIKNSTPETPIFEQNAIDFKRLVPEYLPEAPVNAYEEGGYFQYVIVNAETDPTVKVYDLTIISTIQDIENKIQVFRENKGFSPVGQILADGRYTIDYKAIGYKTAPEVKSPYSGQPLSLFMDSKSQVYVNYLPDIYNAVKASKEKLPKGKDLRYLLYAKSPYVPVASVPYALNDKGEVNFLLKTPSK
ncbi:hypothetical protein PU629_14565 [Pullulanibacillus sp. KACC 23026]|uniref:hypothetical protein n=1 Tax=Pullulanibacillus sp. KACC 23026 TaxID=3028315 RepID=UPI0023AE9C0E|nr:hypothetical protein [Pullulanibacillus sp. KACC 23026]WEG11381.1 hypothetical protein PU629_14565 [Pullulanibacillus sp. KACC 23026]